MIILIRTLILYLLVILVMRLMGKRQIGQLQPFELAVTIMISELAAVPMQNTGIPLINGIIPILTLLIAQLVISFLSIKSKTIREIICGKPTVLINNGRINENKLRDELYTVNDLIEQLRLKDTPNISDVEFAILETNGELSIIPKVAKRPPTLSDLNVTGQYEGLNLPVIINGNIILHNLKLLNLDKSNLDEILKQNSISNINNIFLGCLDESGKFFFQLNDDLDN